MNSDLLNINTSHGPDRDGLFKTIAGLLLSAGIPAREAA